MRETLLRALGVIQLIVIPGIVEEKTALATVVPLLLSTGLLLDVFLRAGFTCPALFTVMLLLGILPATALCAAWLLGCLAAVVSKSSLPTPVRWAPPLLVASGALPPDTFYKVVCGTALLLTAVLSVVLPVGACFGIASIPTDFSRCTWFEVVLSLATWLDTVWELLLATPLSVVGVSSTSISSVKSTYTLLWHFPLSNLNCYISPWSVYLSCSVDSKCGCSYTCLLAIC